MKLRSLFMAILSAAALFAGCETTGELGVPMIELDVENVTFEQAGGSKTIKLTSTRDWTMDTEVEWVRVDPSSGEASSDAQTITITVLPNDGMDRTADLVFSNSMEEAVLTVTQEGPGGSTEALVVYSNNFDKAAAVKDGSYWPYPNQSDCWQNQTGTGAAAVTFGSSNVTVRNNSNSSVYEGASGTNNIFFGKVSNYFTIGNISLPSATSYLLSFGAIRNLYEATDNTFVPAEFHVWLSNDGNKWVELPYSFADGPTDDWNMASAAFTVPGGTEKLYLTFTADLASSYRLDDLSLVISDTEGTAVDFASGTEKDFEAGSSTGGGTVTPPSDITTVTVAEFNEKPVSTTEWYRLTGVVGGPINTQYGNFDLTDETGTVYVYGISNWSEYSSDFAEGGTVTVVGQRYEYNGKIEVYEGYIESYVKGEGGGEVTPPSDIITVTVAEFNEKPVSTTEWYRLTGIVGGPINTQYGNFDLTDETGTVYVYGISNWSEYSSDFAEGGTVTVVGQRYDYNGKIEVLEGYIESYVKGEGGGEVTPPEDDVDPNATVITLDASSKLCDEFPEGSTGVTVTTSYTIGYYEWTFSPSSGNKFSWYTDGYVLWGKKGGYILFPSVEGKALAKVTILTGKNASTSVQVGVYDEAGTTAVSGGEAITLNAKNTEFSYDLAGTEPGARYQFKVMNDKNAQFQKLTLIYE